MVVLSALVAVVGVVLFHIALVRTMRANAGIRIPYFRNAEVVPPGSIATRALGAGMLVFGGVMLATTAWYLPLAVVVAGPVVALVAILLHNAEAQRRARV